MKKETLMLIALAVMGLSSCHEKTDYLNKSLSFEQRAEDLLGRLTLKEKIFLMQNN